MQVVIDTSVVHLARSAGDELSLLQRVMQQNHTLAVDLGKHIIREYYQHVDFTFNSPVGPWFAVMLGRMEWMSGQLSDQQVDALEAAGFHDNDDHPFIGVATRTDSGILLHSDSDYDVTPAVENALRVLGVRPYRAAQALAASIL